MSTEPVGIYQSYEKKGVSGDDAPGEAGAPTPADSSVPHKSSEQGPSSLPLPSES